MSRVCVRVRPADLADVPGLVGLTKSLDVTTGTFSGRPLNDATTDHLAARFEQIITDGRPILLIAVDDSTAEPVGLLLARHDEIGAIDVIPVLHVSHLMVAPRHRRRGVGRALLSAAVQLAEDAGVDRIIATAGAGSREANRYLSRVGFAPLVVHRMAPVGVLRRSLGMAETGERMAVLRRARLVRAQRTAHARAARRGA